MLRSAIALAFVIQAGSASARNIVLTNDDGLTSNVIALYHALKARGDDVIVSVPCTNQSGMGAAVYFMKPVTPLQNACRNDAAKIGDPGAGAMTRTDLPSDFFYVNGTPVMSMLYGIDVAAAARWGRAPDLVLSGPNEGQNIGSIIVSSGTVGNTQHALARGIPAIALSAGADTTDDARLANMKSPIIARLTVQLLSFLDATARKGPLLPSGVALNVNFPDHLEGAHWQIARIGTSTPYSIKFVANLAASGAPGVAITMADQPFSADQAQDEAVIYRDQIAISVMQLGFDAAPANAKSVSRRLQRLLAR